MIFIIPRNHIVKMCFWGIVDYSQIMNWIIKEISIKRQYFIDILSIDRI